MKKQVTVLIIEDDLDLAEICKEKLIEVGFIVHSCSKIVDAQFKLRNQAYDAIILDLQLEGGDGEMIINGVRKDKKALNYSTPILITSGNLDPFFIKEFGKELSGVFVKPFEINAVIDRIKGLTQDAA